MSPVSCFTRRAAEAGGGRFGVRFGCLYAPSNGWSLQFKRDRAVVQTKGTDRGTDRGQTGETDGGQTVEADRGTDKGTDSGHTEGQTVGTARL